MCLSRTSRQRRRLASARTRPPKSLRSWRRWRIFRTRRCRKSKPRREDPKRRAGRLPPWMRRSAGRHGRLPTPLCQAGCPRPRPMRQAGPHSAAPWCSPCCRGENRIARRQSWRREKRAGAWLSRPLPVRARTARRPRWTVPNGLRQAGPARTARLSSIRNADRARRALPRLLSAFRIGRGSQWRQRSRSRRCAVHRRCGLHRHGG